MIDKRRMQYEKDAASNLGAHSALDHIGFRPRRPHQSPDFVLSIVGSVDCGGMALCKCWENRYLQVCQESWSSVISGIEQRKRKINGNKQLCPYS